jgi:hypothetical protein
MAEDRQGARPPAVRMATFFTDFVSGILRKLEV